MQEQITQREELNRCYEVWRQTNRAYEEWAKRHHTSDCCLWVLLSVSQGACTQKQISRHWSMPKQTVNMVLKDLAQKGYVELTPLPEDKRNKQIQFTPAGRMYADGILSQLRKVELAVIERMGIHRIRRMNEDGEAFLALFRELGEEG